MAEIEDVVRAAQRGGQPVAAVIVHRDADVIDPEGSQEQVLAAQFANALPHPVPAVPVVTIESWWLHHADATESINPRTWKRALPRKSFDCDADPTPKKTLQRLTRAKGLEYSEADSPRIASAIGGYTGTIGSSSSFARFMAAVSLLPR